MTDRRPRELRLALSMNGGVSLAVWIGGAVSEIDCLRSGDGFWADLLEACDFQPKALVDVMTGASAGGLNAVLMAQAIRSGKPFSKFLKLWENHADIDKLLKGPLHATNYDQRAVLKADYFKDRLLEALRDPPGTTAALDQNLAVFASATLVRPNPVAFKDVPGKPITETRSDAYFHINRRGPSSRGLDGFEPSELVVDNVEALALVGRATSSLPGLFEPVTFLRADFGSRLVGAFSDHRPDVEVMDGGVIDNVPISRAIRAIANSPAEGRVRRVLLYLHPDPGGRRGPSADRDPETALQVVQSFFGKRKETIREDIELLRSHNDAVERRRDEGDALLKSFAERHYQVDEGRAALAQSINSAMLLRAAIDPPSELTWHAPNVERLAPLVDGPGNSSKAELADDIRQTVSDPGVLVAVATRRIMLGLQRIISSISAAAPDVVFDDALPQIYELSLLCDVITSYQLARFLGHGEGSAATTGLTRSRRELDALIVGDTLDDETWNALASWDLTAATRVAGGHSLREHLGVRVDKILECLPNPPEDLDSPAADVLRRLKRGDVSPQTLDDALLPLAAESVASDQPIEFVRVAGDVSTPASDAFLEYDRKGQHKIAGLQLHHLGAFFDREWRTNDWWWGRLDSVRALLDVVLDREAVEALRTSNYLAEKKFDETDRSIEDIKLWLLETRQLELLNERFASNYVSFKEATESAEFVAWAKSDRRLTALLGRRRLTSTAIRGVITASKMLRCGLSTVSKMALTAVRPVLLATAGVALAGRRAAAAIAWTVCVMVAVRAHDPSDRWILLVAGALLSLGVAALVEVKFRPALKSRWEWWPYGYAAVGVAAGVVGVLYNKDARTESLAAHSWNVWWLIPPLAAGLSAVMLFFWMRWWAAVGLTALTSLLYFLFAHAAFRLEDGDPVAYWPKWWMFHSMWVCWLIAILGMPILIGFMHDDMLRPYPDEPEAAGDAYA